MATQTEWHGAARPVWSAVKVAAVGLGIAVLDTAIVVIVVISLVKDWIESIAVRPDFGNELSWLMLAVVIGNPIAFGALFIAIFGIALPVLYARRKKNGKGPVNPWLVGGIAVAAVTAACVWLFDFVWEGRHTILAIHTIPALVVTAISLALFIPRLNANLRRAMPLWRATERHWPD